MSERVPSNPWLSCISRGGPVVSWPSKTAKRHWWMQMYCCSVWTIQTLSFRIAQTIPKMSTYFDTNICCNILSRVMKVPLRPTPALQCTTMGLWSGLTRSLNARTNLARVWGGLGTPKSGQVVKWKCCITLFTSPCDKQYQISVKGPGNAQVLKCNLTKLLWQTVSTGIEHGKEATYSAQHELRDAPVRIVRLIEYRDANISIVHG